MNMQELYDSAINIMNSIKASGGNYATYDSMSVSVVLSESGKPFTGMNSATIVDGKLKSTCSEYNAITSMMLAGETKINKMISVSFKSNGIVVPCEDCQKLMIEINPENRLAMVGISKNEGITLESLKAAQAAQAAAQAAAEEAALEEAEQESVEEQAEEIAAEETEQEAVEEQTEEIVAEETEQEAVEEQAEEITAEETEQEETAEQTKEITAEDAEQEAVEEQAEEIATEEAEQEETAEHTEEAAEEKSESEPEYQTNSAGVNFVSRVSADVDNPFYEAPKSTPKPPPTQQDGSPNFESYTNEPPKPRTLFSTPTPQAQPAYNNAQVHSPSNIQPVSQQVSQPTTAYQGTYAANSVNAPQSVQSVQSPQTVQSVQSPQTAQPQNQYASSYSTGFSASIQSVQQQAAAYGYGQPQANAYAQPQSVNMYGNAAQPVQPQSVNTMYPQQNLNQQAYYQAAYGQQSVQTPNVQPQAQSSQFVQTPQTAQPQSDYMSAYQAPYQQNPQQSMVFQAPYGSTPKNPYYAQSANTNTGMVGGKMLSGIQSPLATGTGMVSPVASLNADSEGSSIYKQRLNELLGDSSSTVTPPINNSNNNNNSNQELHKEKENTEQFDSSKSDLFKSVQEKKRLAKIDAKFAKKVKKKGF